MSWVEVTAEQKGKERQQFDVLIPPQNDCYYYSNVERVSTVFSRRALTYFYEDEGRNYYSFGNEENKRR